MASFIVAIPQLFIFRQTLFAGSRTKYRCASTGYTAEWQRRVYFTVFATYVLIIPVLLMTFWYVQIVHTVNTSSKVWTQNVRVGQATVAQSMTLTSPTKVKTVKLALTIIIVFVVCWAPYMVLTLIEIYSNGRFRIPSWCDGVLQTICLVQSSLNPFIYLAFSQRKAYSPTLILAAASTHTHDRPSGMRRRRHRRERGGSISLCSLSETPLRKGAVNGTDERSTADSCSRKHCGWSRPKKDKDFRVI